MIVRRHLSFSLAAAALFALSACGGAVATDAPALLTLDEIAARSDAASDTTRGLQVQRALEYRGARLRARAAQIRRAGIADPERRTLLRRADALKSRQD
ncbi:MAG: hypothetical protein KDK01_08895 [Rhodobacteraceae bacterium]|jgi:hypothetical protein|nr:hypothetical protein [Paracoccaceae bacterium]